MHKEILTTEQVALIPLVASFSKKFGLVGGTAIALHLGHRESIDFDLFSMEAFNNATLKRKVSEKKTITQVLVQKEGEFTFLIDPVKITFFHFPFTVPFSERFENDIRLPDILSLAAMKAYALGMRAKWKDYVDLYFILNTAHTLSDITLRAEELFGVHFNEKIFRTQLSYFVDINYSEEVIYRPGFETEQEEIHAKLTEWSLS